MLIKGDASEASSFRSVEIKLSPWLRWFRVSMCLQARYPSHMEGWSTSILSSMDAASREEFDFLSNITMQWNLLMDFVCYIERHNIDSAERFIASIETIDRVDFMYGIFSGLLPRQTVKEALEGSLETLDTDSPIFRHYVSVERARWLIEHEKTCARASRPSSRCTGSRCSLDSGRTSVSESSIALQTNVACSGRLVQKAISETAIPRSLSSRVPYDSKNKSNFPTAARTLKTW